MLLPAAETGVFIVNNIARSGRPTDAAYEQRP